MKSVLLFLVATLLAGASAAFGSMVGHLGGDTGVMIGGVAGGLLGALASVCIAAWRRWIMPPQFLTTAIGAALGFMLAAVIAVNTLSSPVGPVLSCFLVGIGVVVGASRRMPGATSA